MYQLFANYYDYHRQNEIHTDNLPTLETAVNAAQTALSGNEHYKSITIVMNDSDVKRVTR